MRIAFLADIHGNLPALEAVVKDVDAQAPDVVYLVGDQINRAPWNNEVLDLLESRRWTGIEGNHERIVGRLGTPNNRPPFTNRIMFSTLWWTMEQLRPAHLRAVRVLPAEIKLDFPEGPPILMVHAKPGHSALGLFPDMDDARLAIEMQHVDASVLICAHTHRPMVRMVQNESGRTWHIWNGGSIGMPYNGDPRAQYLLVDSHNGHWRPTLRAVDYDRNGLRTAYETSGMLREIGPSAELHLRTALTGEPWSSDFGYWYRQQPPEMHNDLSGAVAIYLARHGPGNWAFRSV